MNQPLTTRNHSARLAARQPKMTGRPVSFGRSVSSPVGRSANPRFRHPKAGPLTLLPNLPDKSPTSPPPVRHSDKMLQTHSARCVSPPSRHHSAMAQCQPLAWAAPSLAMPAGRRATLPLASNANTSSAVSGGVALEEPRSRRPRWRSARVTS